MRIGIDAKWFFTGPVSTRVVLQNLLPELFSLFPEYEWVIFLDKKDKEIPFPIVSENIRLQYIWAGNNLLSNLLLISGKLKSLGVDVMIYQTFPAFKHNIPSVSFIHDVLFREFPEFFTWKERLYFSPLSWLTRNRSDRLIATTAFVANDLLKFKYTTSKSRIDIVPLAVTKLYKPAKDQNQVKLSQLKEKYLLPEEFLLFVGRLNVRKNIENLLRAIPLLRDTKIKLVIVGEADWKTPDLKSILLDQEVKKRIILTGAMSNEELVLTYSIARIFCFPSFAEGFGLPPLEAMASGVPVIVSETTALPEVCGNAAVYINPHHPESIAEAIDSLLGNTELYNLQKLRGLEKAKAFTWIKSAQAFMNSIHHVLNIP